MRKPGELSLVEDTPDDGTLFIVLLHRAWDAL
jgi:hypothetical protein